MIQTFFVREVGPGSGVYGTR